MSRKLRFAVNGTGFVSRMAHFPSIKELTQAELVAVCSKREAHAREAAERWGAKAWYTDYAKVLKRDDVDAVVEATPNFLHAENVVAAAEAGKHIFCEKPMACTNRETEDMLKAVAKAGVKMYVGHNQRFWNQHEIAKELIDSGVIGKLLACRSGLRESYKLIGQFMATEYRWRPEEAGAGALFDLGTHRIDLLRWFAGNIKKVVGLALHQTIPAELDDNVWLTFRFESGAIGSLDADRYTPTGSNVTELYGTEGTIFISSESFHPFAPVPLAMYTEKPEDEIPQVVEKYFYPPWHQLRSPSKHWITISPPRDNAWFKQMAHFVDCVLNDKTPRVTGEDGAKAVEAALAVYKSMETGGWVDLPLKEEIIPPGYKPRRL